MTPALMEWAEHIEQIGLGAQIASSRYLFPVVEGIHLIGLSIAVGLLFLTDLRLIGLVLKRIPAMVVVKQLRPYVLAGFVIVFISGVLLFWAEASTALASPIFPYKMGFMLIAGLNAAYFEFVIARRPEALVALDIPPPSMRYAGAASLFLWTVVVICGRLIPYLPGPMT